MQKPGHRVLSCCVVASVLSGYTSVSQTSAVLGGKEPELKRRVPEGNCPVDVLVDEEDRTPALCEVYLRPMLRIVYGKWILGLPEEIEKPQLAKGRVTVEVKIMADGKVEQAVITEHAPLKVMDDDALAAVRDAIYKPLPSEFRKPTLTLRLHFVYNPDPAS